MHLPPRGRIRRAGRHGEGPTIHSHQETINRRPAIHLPFRAF
ncbi:hypothetical protein BDI4_10205 [Burkholderia diffusa]|nr:hypothetical protein BDI4_10205 [Burkholderia diffusa]